MERSTGILMPIPSLGSGYSIGTLSKVAYAFVDFLAKARQTYWQILPLVPTGYGNFPYQPLSTFAGKIHHITATCGRLNNF